MVTTHFQYSPCFVDWHTVVDDFGNATRPFEFTGIRAVAWWNAYRFANGQTFEQAEYCSVGAVVAEH